MKSNFQQGDGLTPRLLFLLSGCLEETIQTVFSLKKGKWLIVTNRNKWFFKRYASLAQLKKQIQLSHFLLDNGFRQVIPFHSVGPIKFENQFFAIMPYIQPAKKPFSFRTSGEREEALQLLSLFHRQTEKLPEGIAAGFPKFDQTGKWSKRLAAFQSEFAELARCFPSAVLDNYAEMGKWCLDRLSNGEQDRETAALIHGDVAAHNFFRSSEDVLYLIDFDLAARAPGLFDYVQWTHRVLPLVGWKLEKVLEHQAVSRHAQQRNWLLYTLFPADVFRECRRWLYAPLKEKPAAYKHAYELTVQPFMQRLHFFRKWKEEWERRYG
ncbi:phosphotransferase [Bacillus badius]|uniref:hypothetical protein n=1 Tax=Bacillus badius TaxID=1455 RepID=UPI002E1C9679|nr:phosphotransferase [Bacillus badius]